MGAFFHNHLMRHIPHPGGGHQKTHSVADIVEVGLFVHFQGNFQVGCGSGADTLGQDMSPAATAELSVVKLLKILADQVKHIKP